MPSTRSASYSRGFTSRRPRERYGHAVAGVGPAPATAHDPSSPVCVAGGAGTDGVAVVIRDDEIANRRADVIGGMTSGSAEVHLQSIGMNLVRLVVELQRRGGRRSQHEIRLGHHDGEVERGLVPRGVRQRGKIFGTGIRVLATPILILQAQLEGLRRVEA